MVRLYAFVVFFLLLMLPLDLEVIRQCGLEPDLKLFDAGDDTEVGERGLTLRFVVLERSPVETSYQFPAYFPVVVKR